MDLLQCIYMVAYQLSAASSLAACGDLITAVFDFAHGICALKLTEHQIALFSALVLINAGMIDTAASVMVKETLDYKSEFTRRLNGMRGEEKETSFRFPIPNISE